MCSSTATRSPRCNSTDKVVPPKPQSQNGEIRDPPVLTNPRSHAPNLSGQIRNPPQPADRPSDRTPSVIPSSPEVHLCLHQHLRVPRKPRLRRFHSKRESDNELTNSSSSEAINPALNSTTGSKPKRRFSKLKKKPSLIRALSAQSGPKGEVIISALPPGTMAAHWSQNADIHSAHAAPAPLTSRVFSAAAVCVDWFLASDLRIAAPASTVG